jgi:hypothetical protein
MVHTPTPADFKTDGATQLIQIETTGERVVLGPSYNGRSRSWCRD